MRGGENQGPQGLCNVLGGAGASAPHICACAVAKGCCVSPRTNWGWGRISCWWGRICWGFQRGKSGSLGSSLSDSHKPCSLSATCAFQHSFWGHLDSHVGIFLPVTPDAFYFKGSGLLENVLRLFHNFPWFPLRYVLFFFFSFFFHLFVVALLCLCPLLCETWNLSLTSQLLTFTMTVSPATPKSNTGITFTLICCPCVCEKKKKTRAEIPRCSSPKSYEILHMMKCYLLVIRQGIAPPRRKQIFSG